DPRRGRRIGPFAARGYPRRRSRAAPRRIAHRRARPAAAADLLRARRASRRRRAGEARLRARQGGARRNSGLAPPRRARSASAALLAAFAARAESGRTLFIQSAVENPDDTATFPLYRGTSNGQTVWYVIFNSSDGADADTLGVSRVDKLANARGSQAVQKVSMVNGAI